MRKKSFEVAVQFIWQFGLSTILALGLVSASARASGLRFEAELETPKITDLGNATQTNDGETLTIHLKNGTLKLSPFNQTDKTIQIRTVLYVRSDATPKSVPSMDDETTLKPLYNSTFLTNLNMDAELREMNVDGTLLYKLKLNPRTPMPLK